MKEHMRSINVMINVFRVAVMLPSRARDPQRAKANYLASGQKHMAKGQ